MLQRSGLRMKVLKVCIMRTVFSPVCPSLSLYYWSCKGRILWITVLKKKLESNASPSNNHSKNFVLLFLFIFYIVCLLVALEQIRPSRALSLQAGFWHAHQFLVFNCSIAQNVQPFFFFFFLVNNCFGIT